MAKDKKRESLKPIEGDNRSLRHRLTLREEIVLALLPTVTVLIVFGFVEVFSQLYVNYQIEKVVVYDN